ncbi:hypothetical protein ACWFR5_28435 [Streptomyces sp. NPDC055092]
MDTDPDKADTAVFCESYGVPPEHLEARKVSFAPMETAVNETAMEYGGPTPTHSR